MRFLSQASIALIIGTALLVISCGCGSSSPNLTNPENLTQAQATQLGTEGFTVLSEALFSAVSNTACNSSPCNISYTYQCQSSGSITVSGTVTQTSLSTFTAAITEAPTNCSDGTLVINAPIVTIGVTGGLGPSTITVIPLTAKGNVSYAPA